MQCMDLNETGALNCWVTIRKGQQGELSSLCKKKDTNG